MANKAEKRKAERYAQKVKILNDRLKNPTLNDIYQMENYVAFQLLYINDAAYNCCKLLGDELKKIPYRSNQMKKIYAALMKRWAEYNDMVEHTGLNLNSVANLFSEMDEYVDDCVDGIRKAMRESLSGHDITNSDWLADIQSAVILCIYAVEAGRKMVINITKISPRASCLNALIAKRPLDVIENMSKIAQQAHCKMNYNIDLNKIPEITSALNRLNDTFFNPDNFIEAQKVSDEINVKEGNKIIM